MQKTRQESAQQPQNRRTGIESIIKGPKMLLKKWVTSLKGDVSVVVTLDSSFSSVVKNTSQA